MPSAPNALISVYENVSSESDVPLTEVRANSSDPSDENASGTMVRVVCADPAVETDRATKSAPTKRALLNAGTFMALVRLELTRDLRTTYKPGSLASNQAGTLSNSIIQHLRLLVPFALVLAAGVGACAGSKSERDLLIEANAALARGEVEVARRIYDGLSSEANPSPDVWLAIAEMQTETGALDAAEATLLRLQDAELTTRQRREAEDVSRALLEALYSVSRGEGPRSPADASAYERALIGLIELDGETRRIAEWEEFILASGRMAVGAPSDQPLRTASGSSRARRANEATASEALGFYLRLLDRAELFEREFELSGEAIAEAERAVDSLRETIHDREFERIWEQEHRSRFVADGRFVSESLAFVVEPSSEWGAQEDATEGDESLLIRARVAPLAVELAAEITGADGAAISLDLDDPSLSGASLEDVVSVEGDGVRVRAEVPFAAVRRAAYLIESTTDDG